MAACGGKIGEDRLNKSLREKNPVKRVFDLAMSYLKLT